MEEVLLASRTVLGAIFLMSALTKLPAPSDFITNVQKYRILPKPLAVGYALALPYVELAVGGLLLTGFFSNWAAVGALAMLSTFAAAVGIALIRKQSLDCTCFGLLYRERVGPTTLLRDGVLIALALVVLVLDDGLLTVMHLADNVHRMSYAVALVGLVGAFALATLLALLNLREARRRRSMA